jgi:hypothetical protein
MTDEEINALAGGLPNQTVSLRCAVANRQGKRWARVMCWFLSWAVQRDHCELQFTNAPSPWWVYVRAGICFAVAIRTIVWAARWLILALSVLVL